MLRKYGYGLWKQILGIKWSEKFRNEDVLLVVEENRAMIN